MREKMVELIRQIVIPFWAGQIADHLISNDVVPVCRCKDCKWQHTIDCPMNYEVATYDEVVGHDTYMATNACNDDGFCWCGEREDGDGK